MRSRHVSHARVSEANHKYYNYTQMMLYSNFSDTHTHNYNSCTMRCRHVSHTCVSEVNTNNIRLLLQSNVRSADVHVGRLYSK